MEVACLWWAFRITASSDSDPRRLTSHTTSCCHCGLSSTCDACPTLMDSIPAICDLPIHGVSGKPDAHLYDSHDKFCTTSCSFRVPLVQAANAPAWRNHVLSSVSTPFHLQSCDREKHLHSQGAAAGSASERVQRPKLDPCAESMKS